jgi:iron complex outermembrane receptor protein
LIELAKRVVAARRVRRGVRSGLFVGAAISALASPAYCAEDSNSTRIEELVVTAQKRAENLQDVPLAISAIRGEALQEMRITDLKQLIRVDPSLRFKQTVSNGFSQFLIRGIGTSVFTVGVDQSVGTVLDGVTVFDQGSISTLADVERVEVLRGPQGMLFGKNASAGVVNIVTKRPVLRSLEATAHLAYGTNDTRELQLIENLPIGENAALRLVQTYNHRDGVVRNAISRQYMDPQDVVTLAAKLLWVRDRLNIYATADYSVSDDFCCAATWRRSPPGFAPSTDAARYAFAIRPGNVTSSAGGPSFGNAHTYGGSLQLEYDLGGGHTLTSISAARHSYRFTSYDGDLASPSYVDEQQNIPRVTQFSQELRIASPTDAAVDYVAGLYAFAQEARLTVRQGGRLEWSNPTSGGQIFQALPIAPGDRFDARRHTKTESTSAAAFAQVNYHPSSSLTISAGARLTYDNLEFAYYLDNTPGFRILPGSVIINFNQKTDHTNLSYRIGATYSLSPDVMVYASVARGYKGPGFSGYTITSLTSDERVRPEIPTAYEVGIKSTWLDRRIVLNANFFRTDVKDFQAQVADLSNPTFSARVLNAANLSTRGIEASFVARPTPELSLTASGAYTDAHYENFPGVACYFGQPKVAQGGPCVAPPSRPTSPDGVFNADGLPLAGTPKYAFQLGASYERELSAELTGHARINWDWQDDVNYNPSGDPGTVQGAFGLLGGSVGIESQRDGWRLSIWATNILDKRWSPQISPSPVTTLNPGGYSQFYSPDSFRRVGVSFDSRF